jgi:DNA-directed RNA polymerase subunit RPC12/RpoP
MENQHHEMVLEMTHASGMQGWYCPACGRRILLLVPPKLEMCMLPILGVRVVYELGQLR